MNGSNVKSEGQAKNDTNSAMRTVEEPEVPLSASAKELIEYKPEKDPTL